MSRFLLLAISGALGTLGRYLLSGSLHALFGAQFPYGTFVVNVLGCFVIGFLGTLVDEKYFLASDFRMAVFIGFLGAFTTFSSFAYETWMLFKAGEFFFAACNVFGSLILCFAGLLIGVLFARLF
ncbi:MAG: hypothetical protein A3I05_04200 [Deltaproteobacteria bacterium RIFCSPLOWO2_02_FULL_44_10]|nr:MAG: hypothetical protein A3C46_03655 [Deltaproteobacteria bacterium RIFCSPHIGHO2_02_FULL_44_16]OGQ46345.1 MAG: hypothetical protein A3I05_04200 [Deltaproteobacteria bacterium RIFCSPLOWO2_02_FULL_44_10]